MARKPTKNKLNPARKPSGIPSRSMSRRDFLKQASAGIAFATTTSILTLSMSGCKKIPNSEQKGAVARKRTTRARSQNVIHTVTSAETRKGVFDLPTSGGMSDFTAKLKARQKALNPHLSEFSGKKIEIWIPEKNAKIENNQTKGHYLSFKPIQGQIFYSITLPVEGKKIIAIGTSGEPHIHVYPDRGAVIQDLEHGMTNLREDIQKAGQDWRSVLSELQK